MEHFGMKSNPFYGINGILLVVVFTVLRVLTAPFAWFAQYTTQPYLASAPPVQYYFFQTMFIVVILNVYWGYLVLKGALKHFLSPASGIKKKRT
jgi:hypothetical protein